MTEPIYFSAFAHLPIPWPERRLRWTWEITDGMTGPVIASGTTLTERGARRAQAAAAERCVCIAGDCHADRRPVLHPLSAMEAHRLTDRLDRDGIPVTVKVDGPGVVLWPALALTSEQEAHVLNVVVPATDAPVHWAGVA